MRKLIAMVLIGAGAVFVSAQAPAQAMIASGAVASKVSEQAKSGVEEVRHRGWRHRGWHRHRHWRHRHWRHRHWRHRHWYRPYYYSPYYYPYGYRYYRRPRLGIYFSL